MGNLKQRLIKPGRDYNYAEGVKVRASAQIRADQIVAISGSEGVYLKVQPADANDVNKNIGRLMIAKHDIPVNGYGVVLPWKLVTTVDTSTGSAAVGDPVYLAATAADSVAGNLTLAAPTGDAKIVVVGRISIAATVANGGAILVHADAPEVRAQGGTLSGGDAKPLPSETLTFVVHFGNVTEDNTFTNLPFPIFLTDACIVSGAAAVGLIVKDNADADCLTCVATGGSAGAMSRATTYAVAAADIPAGGSMKLTRTGTENAGDYAIITAIRA